ncbi:hypothetical protein H634G_07096 [Metarhizium anisopliae BRIP 53293]|uniref:DUF7587 domain-containing protein n=1 Tax=Metarhizium anisopliae BRIP 53293 TaxID=1291518 RepID=A0A0D9NTH1_METAN|nr:hypothetical protein H634G_07096 [Metarhizium anisopliae BRIP 53293]KJK94466.1 hypothetical protein H633G_01671 [Metarhizium anisopliae BRIP 53284]
MAEYRYRYRYFYRVEDEHSQAVTTPGKGISAAGRADLNLSAMHGNQAEELRWNLQNHLDWSSNYESPFISAYDDEDVAFSIAEGRKEKLGREHVTVTKIDVSKVHGQIEFRELRPLAERLGVWIPDKAYHNSECEWIFLHDIPDEAVVGVVEF